MSKGSKRRPTNTDRFSAGWDRAFGKAESVSLFNPCVGDYIDVIDPDISRGILLGMEATYRCDVCGCDHTVEISTGEV